MSAPLHCSVKGPEIAPAVVLLHPIAVSSDIWALQLPVLSERFRVFAVDLPGHGKSSAIAGETIAQYAGQVVETLARLGVQRAAFVGLSLGGMVAQRIAIDNPEKVSALTLACTGAKTAPEAAELWRARAEAARASGMESQVQQTLARWFTLRFAEAAPATLAWVGRMIGATPLSGYVSASRAICELDQLDALANISAPTLVLAGEEDKALPLSVAQGIAMRIEGAELQTLDAAHLANVEQPTAFTEAVSRFLSARL